MYSKVKLKGVIRLSEKMTPFEAEDVNLCGLLKQDIMNYANEQKELRYDISNDIESVLIERGIIREDPKYYADDFVKNCNLINRVIRLVVLYVRRGNFTLTGRIKFDDFGMYKNGFAGTAYSDLDISHIIDMVRDPEEDAYTHLTDFDKNDPMFTSTKKYTEVPSVESLLMKYRPEKTKHDVFEGLPKDEHGRLLLDVDEDGNPDLDDKPTPRKRTLKELREYIHNHSHRRMNNE